MFSPVRILNPVRKKPKPLRLTASARSCGSQFASDRTSGGSFTGGFFPNSPVTNQFTRGVQRGLSFPALSPHCQKKNLFFLLEVGSCGGCVCVRASSPPPPPIEKKWEATGEASQSTRQSRPRRSACNTHSYHHHQCNRASTNFTRSACAFACSSSRSSCSGSSDNLLRCRVTTSMT